MPDSTPPEIDLLRRAYAAFNARDIPAALATMAPDVTWPRAFKGGVVRGHDAVRDYWTEQWAEIDPHAEPVSFHPEAGGRVLVGVRLVVRDRAGAVLADERVGHRFTLAAGRVRSMEVCYPPAVTTPDPHHALREHLLFVLRGGGAHLDFETAVADLPADRRGRTAQPVPHSPWRLLEHLRIAQWDILGFTRNPDHVSPPWPAGYWPDGDAPPDDAAWGRSADAFRADLRAMCELVADPGTDLFTPLPHGDGQTVLREALLVADHNAYHLGQLVVVRRLLGCRPDGG